MLLEIDELKFAVRSTEILRSISMKVEKGEIVCLIGRNGAGKSSILKSIIGIYRPKGGKIRFKGQDITNKSAHDRVMLGLAYSPEDTRVFPGLTVEDNINLGTWITSKTERAASFRYEEALEVFPDLQKLMKRRGQYLSGGEKKMVSITRALALSPSLMLLDESLEGLAPVVVKGFSEAMRNIRDLGISVLLAESNIRNASQVAERSYIVERGEIIFEGDPNRIMEDERLLRIVGR